MALKMSMVWRWHRDGALRTACGYYVCFSVERLLVSALCLVLWRRRDRAGDSVRGEWRWLNHGGMVMVVIRELGIRAALGR